MSLHHGLAVLLDKHLFCFTAQCIFFHGTVVLLLTRTLMNVCTIARVLRSMTPNGFLSMLGGSTFQLSKEVAVYAGDAGRPPHKPYPISRPTAYSKNERRAETAQEKGEASIQDGGN